MVDWSKDEALVAALYDAAIDPEGWTLIGELLPRTFDADGCLVQQVDLKARCAIVLAASGVEGSNWKDYEKHYYQHDLWALRANNRDKDTAHQFHDLVAPSEWENSQIYNDFLVGPSRERMFWGIGSMLSLDRDNIGGFGILRARRHGPLSDEMHGRVLRIVPHLRRAIQLTAKLRATRQASTSFAGVLDLLAVAVLLVRADSSIVYANISAEKLLARGDGLRGSTGGQLLIESHAELQRLRMLVSSAARRVISDPNSAGGATSITRPLAGAPLLALVCPLPQQAADAAAAMIFVTDPLGGIHPRAAVLSTLFGLTPAEAALSVTMADGKKTVQDAATALHWSNETARTFLKSVFRKMNVSRQAEMVAILTRLGLVNHQSGHY